MKTLGSILTIVGSLLLIYALFIMDTSVAVEYPGNYDFGLPSRVNNLGLMADRQNYILGGGISLIAGLILCFIPVPKGIVETSTIRKQDQINEAIEQKSKNEIELLQELKEKGILSPEEYNAKRIEINFNFILQQQIEPIIRLLSESKEKGLLSEEEFIIKKNVAIETETTLLKRMIHKNA